MDKAEKKEELKKISQKVGECQRCPLYKRANRAVPGEGDPDARVFFIGEAPGYYEDQQGIPFCGAAGKLLDRLLQSIELDRERVFIGNMVKHRPPGNRDPLPEEIEACRPWLDQQIKIINPQVIVTLGRFSMAKFLPNAKISRIHGQSREIGFHGKKIILLPMYHPAAGLRRGEILEDLEEDFKKLKEILETKLSEEPSREQLSLV